MKHHKIPYNQSWVTAKNMHKDMAADHFVCLRARSVTNSHAQPEVLTIEAAAKDTWFELWLLHVKHNKVKLSGTGWKMK